MINNNKLFRQKQLAILSRPLNYVQLGKNILQQGNNQQQLANSCSVSGLHHQQSLDGKNEKKEMSQEITRMSSLKQQISFQQQFSQKFQKFCRVPSLKTHIQPTQFSEKRLPYRSNSEIINTDRTLPSLSQLQKESQQTDDSQNSEQQKIRKEISETLEHKALRKFFRIKAEQQQENGTKSSRLEQAIININNYQTNFKKTVVPRPPFRAVKNVSEFQELQEITTDPNISGLSPVLIPNRSGRDKFLSHYNQNSSTSSIFSGLAFLSQAGQLPSKAMKTNQDQYIVLVNFTGSKDLHLFGVCDGHGVNGHLVSNFVKKQLPKQLEIELKKCDNWSTEFIITALSNTYRAIEEELGKSETNIKFSGTTCIIVLLIKTKLYCANIGDSRGLISKQIAGKWFLLPLSHDQNPMNQKEKQRIIDNNGRVDPLHDSNGKPIGPLRVWLKNEGIPGLAMTRSFGDKIAKTVGVCADPEIYQSQLEENDKFIVLGSDGLFEFITNTQIIQNIIPFYEKNQAEKACDRIVKQATAAWKKEDQATDDITCIIIFLQNLGNQK